MDAEIAAHRERSACTDLRAQPRTKCLMEFYFVRDLGRLDAECITVRRRHPWMAPENRMGSLDDFCRVATWALESQPHVPVAIEVPCIIGDVVFTEDDPIINVDGREIHL